MRTCSGCKVEKAASEFYDHSGNRCKECKRKATKVWQQKNSDRRNEWQRNYSQAWEVKNRRREYVRKYYAANKEELDLKQRARTIKRKYGLTVEAYDALMLEQNSLCAICRRELPLVVDHDHETGKVRGLLCNPCNTALGMAQDDVERIRRMADYVQRHSADDTH